MGGVVVKRTKLAAFVLAVLALAMALAALGANAANDDYFTVINDNVRRISEETMPVYRDGEYYVPYTVFDDRSLGIYYSYNQDRYALTLYNKDYTLTFDSPAQVAYDREEQYKIRMTTNAAGTICVPIGFVCEKFGLELQVIRTHPVETIRIVGGDGGLSIEAFREEYQPALVSMYMEFILPSAEPSAEPSGGIGGQPSAEPSNLPSAEPSAPPEPIVVYITFDDGPNRNTEAILDALAEYDMEATFFLLGSQIEQNRDTVRRMVGEGHAVGLHAWSHVSDEMYSSPEALLDEIGRAGDALDTVAQVRTRFFRFPYGSNYDRITGEMRDAVIGAGYRYWDWTIDALDYEQPSAAALAGHVIDGLEDADSTAVILMHDTETTAEALPEVLEYIADGNFVVRTISIGEMPVNFYGDVRTSLTD